MNTEFRNRAFLPIVLPVGILLGMAAVVGGFALILLYTTREVALVLATVAAIGILLAISLAASQDRLDPAKKAVIGLAAAFPIIAGAVVAIAQPVDASLLNINRLPHEVLPEVNVEVVATNSQSFEVSTITLPAETEVGVVFKNEEAGVPHNWAGYIAQGGEPIVNGEIITGPAEENIIFTTPAAGEYWFQCDVHANMNGTLIVEDGAEPSTS